MKHEISHNWLDCRFSQKNKISAAILTEFWQNSVAFSQLWQNPSQLSWLPHQSDRYFGHNASVTNNCDGIPLQFLIDSVKIYLLNTPLYLNPRRSKNLAEFSITMTVKKSIFSVVNSATIFCDQIFFVKNFHHKLFWRMPTQSQIFCHNCGRPFTNKFVTNEISMDEFPSFSLIFVTNVDFFHHKYCKKW